MPLGTFLFAHFCAKGTDLQSLWMGGKMQEIKGNPISLCMANQPKER